MLNCVDPPPRTDLAKMVVAQMRTEDIDPNNQPLFNSFKRTADEILKKPPNQDWLISMLATMNPGCEIFRKDYVKPKVSKFADPDATEDLVDNVAGYFDGLPVAGRSSKKTSTVRFGDTAVAEKQKLRKMKMQSDILAQRIVGQHVRVDMIASSVQASDRLIVLQQPQVPMAGVEEDQKE